MLSKIIVGICGVFLIAGIVLVPYYQSHTDYRSSIVLAKDLFVATLTISGIAVAAENMRRSANATRSAIATSLCGALDGRQARRLQRRLAHSVRSAAGYEDG
jgi:hypothetical protein